MSGPFQSEPEYRLFVEEKKSYPTKLTWFQRWFLKHSQQAWEYSKNHIDGSQYDGRRGAISPTKTSYVSKEINTRNSIDLNLIKADGGWIVQFQDYDEHTDRHHVYHHIIPETEDFGEKLSEIITLQCLRK